MLKPLRDQVIVKRSNPDEKIGSLFVAGTAQKDKTEGIVVAVGTGHVLENGNVIPLEVKVDDKIIFTNNYAEVKHEGETYLVLREDSVLAIVV